MTKPRLLIILTLAAVLWPAATAGNRVRAQTGVLSVTHVAPAAGATNVPLTASVMIAFNRPLVMDSVSFSLTAPDGTITPGMASFDREANAWGFTPLLPLLPGTLYRAALTGATDALGGSLEGPLDWSFSTAGGNPETPPAAPFAWLTATLTLDRDDVTPYYIGEDVRACLELSQPAQAVITYGTGSGTVDVLFEGFVEGRQCVFLHLVGQATGTRQIYARAWNGRNAVQSIATFTLSFAP